jgi:hypothetical protein
MSAPDRFIAWCKQEQASLQQQLELSHPLFENAGSDAVATIFAA